MNKEALHPNITQQLPLLEGIIALLVPFAEGAIHDLRTGKIVALFNTISRRKIGDPSPLAELGIDVKDFPDVFEPYYKTNWDGKKLKCTSVTIRDETGEPIGLVCINFDTSFFGDVTTQLQQFLTLKGGLNPIDIFADNWKQQVQGFIDDFTAQKNVALSAMTKDEKSELVQYLYDRGVFNYRDAAVFIAQKLGVSRTTIYNYLKDSRGKSE